MVVDTSALIAILQDEPQRRSFNEAIEAAQTRTISAATLVEASIVLETRFGAEAVRDLDLLISKAQFTIATVDAAQALLAQQAYRQFGKGRHPAGLNFGDCFSYALACALGESLLFKGADFSQTDVELHPASV